jgi:hypothetical protein
VSFVVVRGVLHDLDSGSVGAGDLSLNPSSNSDAESREGGKRDCNRIRGQDAGSHGCTSRGAAPSIQRGVILGAGRI